MKRSASEPGLADKTDNTVGYNLFINVPRLVVIYSTGIYFFAIFAFTVLLHTPTEKRKPTDLLIWVSVAFT